MGWILDFAIGLVADLFGDTVAKDKPWWVQLIASLGCLMAMGLFGAAVCFFLWALLRP